MLCHLPGKISRGDSLKEYAKKIDRLIFEMEGETVGNSSIDHAIILLDRMFKNATDHVRIFSGELNALAYGCPQVLASAQRFLWDANHKLEIITEKDIPEENPFYVNFSKDNVDLYRLDAAASEHVKFHFALMDGCGYRFEGDKTKPGAIAAFGVTEMATDLLGMFDSLKQASTKVQAC